MEVKVSTGRNIRRRDPVIDKEGVFGCIEEAELKPAEQERVKHQEMINEAPKKETKTWSVKEIANRLAIWLHLKKPEE